MFFRINHFVSTIKIQVDSVLDSSQGGHEVAELRRWPPTLLADSRAVHRWDEAKTIGRWFAPQTPAMRPLLSNGSAWSDGYVLWDAYLLYRADAKWNETPKGLIRWGRTIVAGRDALKGEFERLFGNVSRR
jgi:hypothetical protein